MCQVAEIRLCGAIYQAAIPERNMFDVHFREGRMKLARSTHALVALGGNLPLGDDRPDAVLRAAFDASMKDPDLIAEAGKLKLEMNPLTGAQVQALVERLYATPEPIVRRARNLLGTEK